jgi:metal-sulfur cluster biosynthetic enzyme
MPAKKLTDHDVRERLREVLDPELQINIVDIGLIYDIILSDDPRKIVILMTLTSPGCPLGNVLDRLIRDKMADLPEINPERDVEIKLTFDPPWTIDMMTEEAKGSLYW